MRVARWGGSLAVRLPRKPVEQLGLRPGDELDIVVASGRRVEVVRKHRREQAVGHIRSRQWPLPPDYRFDRAEADSR